ncbi:MAG: regulator [Acidobacteria bacterium]|jgi:ligand-binding sensor domain-containing protein|nr:regulator [Acidobacteriota bacterium]
MKPRIALLMAALAVLVLVPAAGAEELPYVYTKWKHFTTEDGLPNDHIYSVKVDGPRVWVGTEDGLALIDTPSGKVVKTWKEEDGLPWRAVTAIDVDPNTGDVWLGLFGGGLARLSGGRFDHWHQLNSGLVNDVVYGVAVEHDNVWAATTAGASRYNTRTGEWAIFTEKNAPMEEIWNYGVDYADGKIHLAVWGSGVLEFDVATERWKEYVDPDGEMEIDLYRDDGINHVITTGADFVDGVLWVSTYFGGTRYDGRHWKGYAEQDGGMPSDFVNFVKGRSAQEALYCTDKGLGIITDGPGDTWVVYTRDPDTGRGRARVTKSGEVVELVDMPISLTHSFTIAADIDGNDLWVGTGEGLALAIGEGYYPGLRERRLYAYGPPAPGAPGAEAAAGHAEGGDGAAEDEGR